VPKQALEICEQTAAATFGFSYTSSQLRLVDTVEYSMVYSRPWFSQKSAEYFVDTDGLLKYHGIHHRVNGPFVTLVAKIIMLLQE
jgi:hypothetical protein